MKTSQQVKGKAAGVGFHGDFKPLPKNRKIRFADSQTVIKASAAVASEFSGAFSILAK